MKRILIALTILPAIVGAPALAQDHSAHGGAHSPASQAYMQAMKRMDADMSSMPMSGQPGVDFARMMIPHHQSAIDMAKAYLASGENDPTIRKIAEDVVASQEREIGELRDWLKSKGAQ
ncbi:DUF305 domain-containing protein [Aureimonas sp. N4]|uniref:DUF305 domain-containing protein n=1 Tax=Aureimonas sp. N4 TaxID=1638165 RepID=UPI000781507E|nr:DUF305 domain-containing protein [Aureimonas sp. N4]